MVGMESPIDERTLTQIVSELGPGLAEGVATRDEHDAFCAESFAQLRARGLTRMAIPADLGGLGASHSAACTTLRALARHDPSAALALSMHTHAVSTLVYTHRRGASSATATLRRVAGGDLILASTGGRDWLESNGELRAVEGGYRLRARKAFASGAPIADLAVTSAPFRDPDEGWQVLHFAVPLDRDGVRVGDDWVAHGMRATGSHTLFFDDVFVPADAISVRRPRSVFPDMWHVVLGVALPLIFAPYVGVAEAAADLGRSHARRRADDVTTQWSVGEMDSALIVARACHGRMVELARDFDFEPSVALSNELLALESQVVDSVRTVTDAAMEAAGGVGFFRTTGLERLARDMRAAHYHPLPEKAQRLLAGRVGLGLAPVDLSSFA
jgi:acyl-CoA dehydrogenase